MLFPVSSLGSQQQVFENSTDTSAVAFVVQATKNLTATTQDSVDPGYITGRLRGIKWLERDDIEWLSLRLATDFKRTRPPGEKADVSRFDESLLQIYIHLKGETRSSVSKHFSPDFLALSQFQTSRS